MCAGVAILKSQIAYIVLLIWELSLLEKTILLCWQKLVFRAQLSVTFEQLQFVLNAEQGVSQI